MANVLCVVAHPDDEVLGCGGTLAKHAEAGDDVIIQAVSFREGILERFHAAAKVIGARNFAFQGGAGGPTYPDQKLDTFPLADIAKAIRVYTSSQDTYPAHPADIIYTHHPGDLNLDHALTARAVLTAFRPKPGEKPRTILACEVLSSTEYTYPRVFQPNWYVGLTPEHVYKATQALKCYTTEIQDAPHPRSAGILGSHRRIRGSEVGVEFAEAFQLLRGGPF